MRTALQAELKAERKKLEAEFAYTAEAIERTRRGQQAAEAAKKAAAAEAQLAETRTRRASVDAGEIALRREIEAIAQRARTATEQLRTAGVAEDNAVWLMQESEERLERTYGTEREINLLLQKELEEWVAEQERLQGATARRHEIEKQLRQTERTKERAVQAQRDSATHDANLLDEIAAQLGRDA
jgi:hypothetical protein